MRLMLQTQIENSRRDAAREEEFERRQAALEEVVLRLSQSSLSNRQPSRGDDSTQSTSGIDLTRFRTSDGPVFKGPYHDVEAFLTWFKSLKAFFRTKGVTLDFDKITLVGNFITEPNTQAFYEAECDDFIRGSWDEFVSRLFSEALPANWEDKMYQRAQTLRMSTYEDFKTYSTRARSIHNLVNFSNMKISDHQMAKFVELGMVPELQAAVDLWDLTAVSSDFKYHTFEL